MAKSKKITYKRYFNPDFFTGSKTNNLKQITSQGKHKFYFAVRSALLEIIDQIDFKTEEIALLPAFLPEGIILPFRKRKVRIVFYDIKESLDPDIESILKVVNSNVKIRLILLIHYFGKEIDIQRIRMVLNQEIIILEDCAHSFLSKSNFYQNQYTGNKGDVSLFSLTKFLPIPDGGLAIFNNKKLYPQEDITKHLSFSILASWFNFFSLKFKTIYINHPKLTVFDYVSKVLYVLYYNLLCSFNKPYSMTPLSKRLLYSFNIEKARKIRISHIEEINKTILNDVSFLTKETEINPPGYYIKATPNLKDRLNENSIEYLIYNKRWYYSGVLIKNINDLPIESIRSHIMIPISENLNYYQISLIKKVIANAYTD